MTDREFLRHCVATLAYRAAKATRGAPGTFAAFRAFVRDCGTSPPPAGFGT